MNFRFLFIITLAILLPIYMIGQSSENSIEKSANELLEKKIEHNKSLGVANRWKVQIFNGKLDDSKMAYIDFKKKFMEFDATIVFSSPHYKVWIGNCRTRSEAEKILNEVKKQYPRAFLVRPRM